MRELSLSQTEIIIFIGFIGILGVMTALAIMNIVKSTDLEEKDRKVRILTVAVSEAIVISLAVVFLLFFDF